MSSVTDSSAVGVHGPSERTDSPGNGRTSLISRALVAALATVITMTIWEGAKQAFFPPSTIWWSHVLTILFAGVLAFPITLAVLKTLRTRIVSEETSRLTAEAKHAHAEGVLQETESQLAHAEAIVHLGHWSWDITRDAVLWSSEMYRIYGVEPGKFGGHLASVAELVHPDDRLRHETFIADLLSGQSFAPIEYRVARRDGSERVVEVMGARIERDERGAPIRMYGAVLDITERKQAEEALRRSEEKYRSIFENAVEGIFQSAPEGWFMNVNPALARMCGYETPEAMIASVKDIGLQFYVDPKRRDHFRKLLEEQGELRGLESQVYRKDGTLLWISENVRAVRDQAGQVLYYEGTVQDATDRRKAEEDLRLSEERFNKAFRSSPEGITISTLADGRYLEANDSFLQMMGYERNELIGKTAVELNIWANPDARFALIRKFQSDHLVREHETSFRNKAGEPRLVQISGEAIQLQGQSCLLAITRDITDRKQLEEQLRQAQKMEAVGQLAGGIAHDFNNLLGIILGYSDLLLDGLRPDDPRRKKIQMIHESGQKAAAVTRQLLAFSRQQVLQATVLNLNNVVSEVERLLRPLIREDIALAVHLAPELQRVRADRGQIEQILMNLVVNARDAMPDGGTITVETANVEVDENYALTHVPHKPGSYVMLAITDTGLGMDRATQARIFEPFFTTKELGKGTGLGLATVYGIVKQSEGFIWVYSEPQCGTTFKVYLPAAVGKSAERSPIGTAGRPASGTETVLVVEDEKALRELTCETLRSGGYTVLEAEDVDDAMAITRRHTGPIHLLLTDVVMPGMSGHVLADKVLALRPETKVIYTSGYTESARAEHQVRVAGRTFLQKPCARAELLHKVRELLDGTVSDAVR
jgi:two-component system cell cycle sensor histidine kinase/response regulator CckA